MTPWNDLNRKQRSLAVLAKKVLKELHEPGKTAVFLLEGRKMRQLKALYAGKPPKKEVGHVRGRGSLRALAASNVVDVLAFPEPDFFPHPESREKFLGDIFINLALYKRDRRLARRLTIHGLLHLLGYTHGKKSDTLRMEKLEQKLLSRLTPNT